MEPRPSCHGSGLSPALVVKCIRPSLLEAFTHPAKPLGSLPIAQGRRGGVRRARLICKVWCMGKQGWGWAPRLAPRAKEEDRNAEVDVDGRAGGAARGFGSHRGASQERTRDERLRRTTRHE